MKQLSNTKIVCHVSEWDSIQHCLIGEDFEREYPYDMTIADLQQEAHDVLSNWENGIVKMFWGKYQVGTSTRRYGDLICEYLTNFGEKLCGSQKLIHKS